MGIGTALIGFFSSLPEIVKGVSAFMTWIQKISGNDPAGTIKSISACMSQLSVAETLEERQAAAEAIAKAITGKL